MSRPRTYEQRLLQPATRVLADAARSTGGGDVVEFLEGVAAAHGRWSLEDYRLAFPSKRRVPPEEARVWGERILSALQEARLPLALAVASLGQPDLGFGEQRKAGAYYTDFRLARYVASQFVRDFHDDERVVDLAAGSGVLLVALTEAVAAGTQHAADRFVGHTVCAADSNPEALAATRVSLAMLVSELEPLRLLDRRLLPGDSLTRSAAEWEAIAPGGFAAVVGNPPWEKLKVTRHEFLTSHGVERHYGALYEDLDPSLIDDDRAEMVRYVRSLVAASQLQGKGEADLYKLFLELGVRLLRPGGELGLLVPAGLIRSQGTEVLRAFLMEHASHLSLTVLENRASFFAIDTRFKFLSLHARFGPARRKPVVLRHAEGTHDGVSVNGQVRIARPALRRARPDLTVPEVRSEREWVLFRGLVENGTTLAAPEWSHSYQRELDMTNDRKKFELAHVPGSLPLVEGRMVHQHRSMAKAYLSGTGRSAVWQPLPLGRGRNQPQFWVDPTRLPSSLVARTASARAGFCDVTGQTNERTLLAAVIPAGVVCGNKVPTLTFESTRLDAEQMALAWVALANSIVVDWAARRVVTTSMNYFLLLSLPLPRLSAEALIGLAAGADMLQAAETNHTDPWQVVEKRAEIDAAVAVGFGLAVDDVAMMFRDFQLLDRGQPSLPGETESTITRDLVLATMEELRSEKAGDWAHRVDRARRLGATPYVPADYSAMMSNGRNHEHVA